MMSSDGEEEGGRGEGGGGEGKGGGIGWEKRGEREGGREEKQSLSVSPPLSGWWEEKGEKE